MALYAFDGTGNEDRIGDHEDSNACRFFTAYKDAEKDQDPDDPRGSLYVKGIGQMARTFFGDKLSEAFGIGGHRRVRQALRRLRNNLRAGDDVIDIVGFSRGAGIAVSFANDLAEDYPDLKIRFMGLWDTVGQFGLPGERLQAGHNLGCPGCVVNGYHAMALDENRLLFPLTRMRRDGRPVSGFTEVWFRGVHSDVGGGNGNRAMNCLSLHWMFKAAQRAGLPIDEGHIAANLAHRIPNPQVRNHGLAVGGWRNIIHGDLVHVSVQPLAGRNPAPELSCPRIDDDGVLTQVAVG